MKNILIPILLFATFLASSQTREDIIKSIVWNRAVEKENVLSQYNQYDFSNAFIESVQGYCGSKKNTVKINWEGVLKEPGKQRYLLSGYIDRINSKYYQHKLLLIGYITIDSIQLVKPDPQKDKNLSPNIRLLIKAHYRLHEIYPASSSIGGIHTGKFYGTAILDYISEYTKKSKNRDIVRFDLFRAIYNDNYINAVFMGKWEPYDKQNDSRKPTKCIWFYKLFY